MRLVLRGHYLLALRISDYLRFSPAPVLQHWAISKVQESRNDPEDATRISNLIVKRLHETDSSRGDVVGCADVAAAAWEQGKTVLATKLLEYEARASKQVQLLLGMKEDNLALYKAIRSGDSDLGRLSGTVQ